MNKKLELTLLISVILISVFGLIMIYSASYIWADFKYGDALKFVKNQGLFLIIGIFLMLFISKIDYHIFYKKSNTILLICIILLILVLIPGVGTIRNGSRSWFGIGSFGIQPSEFAKLGIIIFVSKYLSNNNKVNVNIVKEILPILGLTLFIFGLIMLQPDFGTGMVLVMSIVALLFISGLNMKFFYILGFVGLLFLGGVDFSFFLKIGMLGMIGVSILIVVAPYRLSRILSFLNPWSDPLGSGFQIIQSLYAIGPGGLLGFGLGNSRQKHFYLPEPQTDFIFSIISEELGFLGVLIVVSLLATILISGFKIAYKCDDLFGKYLAFGIIFQIAFQACLNLMVVIGLIPVTG